jgi:hypothetical protein
LRTKRSKETLAIIALFVDQGCAASEPSSHADISRQAALFCKKARKKLHSPCNLGRAERVESPPPQGAARRHKVFGAKRRHEVFFASFCSQKEDLPCLSPLGINTQRDKSQSFSLIGVCGDSTPLT